MFEVVLYLVFSYFVIVVALAFVWLAALSLGKARRMATKVWLVCGSLLGLCLPLAPYALVEWQTAAYAPELLPALREGVYEVENQRVIGSLKVPRIGPWGAKAFVVTPTYPPGSGYRGTTFSPEKHGPVWQVVDGSDDCVWSDTGNADGNTFPPCPRVGE